MPGWGAGALLGDVAHRGPHGPVVVTSSGVFRPGDMSGFPDIHFQATQRGQGLRYSGSEDGQARTQASQGRRFRRVAAERD